MTIRMSMQASLIVMLWGVGPDYISNRSYYNTAIITILTDRSMSVGGRSLRSRPEKEVITNIDCFFFQMT